MKLKVGDRVRYDSYIGTVIGLTSSRCSTKWDREKTTIGVCSYRRGWAEKYFTLLRPANEWKGKR